MERADLDLLIPSLPLAEACYILASRFGSEAELALLRLARNYPIIAPSAGEVDRMIELVRQYRDFPLGASDASIIALAERLETPYVVTLDHRHFRAIRPRHVTAFELLPA